MRQLLNADTYYIDAIQWDKERGRVGEKEIEREGEREWIEIKSSCEGLTCYSVCEWRVRWSMQSFIVLNQYTLYMDSQSIPQYFYNFSFNRR